MDDRPRVDSAAASIDDYTFDDDLEHYLTDGCDSVFWDDQHKIKTDYVLGWKLRDLLKNCWILQMQEGGTAITRENLVNIDDVVNSRLSPKYANRRFNINSRWLERFIRRTLRTDGCNDDLESFLADETTSNTNESAGVGLIAK